ncbi:MAG TPA: hypothetical protein VGX92_00385 [Pyrinomonadaceae bacterium]|jgi:hypothetical protein|nr:hypothetical protein [Pyrinomonadaceae bacterium]
MVFSLAHGLLLTDGLLDRLLSLVDGWNRMDKSTAVALSLGVVGVVWNLAALNKASREANKLLEKATEELKRRIGSNLSRLRSQEFIDGSSIRSMALSIQRSRRCPVLTDAVISEVIRSLASDLEEQFEGEALRRKKRALGVALKEFDPKGPSLASIAFTDRIFAFVLSALAFSLGILSAQFLLTSIASRSSFISLAIWLLPLLQLLLVYSNKRATHFWRAQLSAADAEPTGASQSRGGDDVQLHPVLDIFLLMSMSLSHKVHLSWAPLWEELAFRFLPALVLPIFGAWTAFQAGKLLNIDPTGLRSLVAVSAIIMVGAGFYISLVLFARWHEYKHFTVRKLLAEFSRLQRSIILAEVRGQTASRNDLQECISICRRLWVITGYSIYEEREKEMKRMLAESRAS